MLEGRRWLFSFCKTTKLNRRVLKLYECETWQFALRNEQHLKVFKNKMLFRIFRLKKNELMREFRRLNNAESHELFLINIIQVITWQRIK